MDEGKKEEAEEGRVRSETIRAKTELSMQMAR